MGFSKSPVSQVFTYVPHAQPGMWDKSRALGPAGTETSSEAPGLYLTGLHVYRAVHNEVL